MSHLTNIYPTAGTTKYIIPLGDSITVGFANQVLTSPTYQLWNGGYRLILQQIATSENKKLFMVGSLMTNSVSMSNPWHEGVSGQVISEIHGRIASLVTSVTPDVILLLAGTNDFYYWVANGTPAISAVQTRYTAMLDTIFSRWPTVKVVCATLGDWYNIIGGTDGPIFATMQGMSEKTDFNNYIIALPGSHPFGANISVVQMHTYINASGLTGDGLHPREIGYRQMAVGWWSVLKTLV